MMTWQRYSSSSIVQYVRPRMLSQTGHYLGSMRSGAFSRYMYSGDFPHRQGCSPSLDLRSVLRRHSIYLSVDHNIQLVWCSCSTAKSHFCISLVHDADEMYGRHAHKQSSSERYEMRFMQNDLIPNTSLCVSEDQCSMYSIEAPLRPRLYSNMHSLDTSLSMYNRYSYRLPLAPQHCPRRLKELCRRKERRLGHFAWLRMERQIGQISRLATLGDVLL